VLVKIVCSDPRSQVVVLEVWYAPDVRQSVKERAKLSYGIRERELVRYKLE